LNFEIAKRGINMREFGIKKRNRILYLVIGVSVILIGGFPTSVQAAGDNDPSAVNLGWDGNMTAWIEEEPDTPSGTSYMLYEHHGGWWADAEKEPLDDDKGNPPPNNPGDEDDLLCWAATVSNMLEWTGWGFVGGMDGTDEFFDYFIDHTTDYGSKNPYGIKWWFTGDLPTHDGDWSVEDVEGGDFWSSSYTWTDYTAASMGGVFVVPDIRTYFLNGYAVGLGIQPFTPPGGHAVTCWGFNYDPDKDPLTEIADYYLGIWISDSDSHKGQTDPDDYLRYYEVEWDSTNLYWYMPNYGSGWKIVDVTGLSPFPGESRPVAEDGGPYVQNEGSAVSFSGSGSTDDDTLKYRWDFDGDGKWNTSWSTDPSASFKWYDDYSGVVYLEVFDDRLRDMDFTTVTINNVAPAVTAAGSTINENGVATVSGTISDPGILDTFEIVIDWGEDSPQSYSYPAGSTTFSETHKYLDDNPTATISDLYTISVKVTDDDGGIGTAGTTVRVNDLDPVLSAITMDQPNPQFILPLVHTLDFSVSFTDIGTEDTHTAVWDWDDGTTSSGTVSESGGSGTVTGSHVYSSPGTYYVEATVTDDDGGSDTAIIMVEVVDADEAITDLNDYIQGLDDDCFKNKADNRKNSVDNKITAILKILENENLNAVINTLRYDIRDKADGLVDGWTGDDWITEKTAQEHICMKIDDIIAYLETFL
jgi:hypothetical protein